MPVHVEGIMEDEQVVAKQRSEDKPAKGVQTALRAISILEAFTTQAPSLTLSEIAEVVGLSVPTTFRLIRALQSRDLLVVDPDSRQYNLGRGVMALARVITQREDLVPTAMPGLERLRAETKETVSLQMIIGDKRVAVAELVSPHPIRMTSGIGTPYDFGRGSAGKIMLAHFRAAERRRYVGSTPVVAGDELLHLRETGYAVSFGEVVSGANAVAAVVLNSAGNVGGAINITGPSYRFTAERIGEAVPMLLEVADNVTSRLGGPRRTELALDDPRI
ncbi:UNVERIFIED_ORG: DNA-binding IclR family transcriptional regulator [Paenarthrobacter nicotinovorans]